MAKKAKPKAKPKAKASAKMLGEIWYRMQDFTVEELEERCKRFIEKQGK